MFLCASIAHTLKIRKYWQHWRGSGASWIEGFSDVPESAVPIAVYGDEAKYSATYGDKLIALVLQFPLTLKEKGAST